MKAMRVVAWSAAALMSVAVPVLGQAKPLRYNVQPGARRVYQRTTRTETTITAGDQTSRQVTEVPLRREDLIVEVKTDPPQMRVVSLETPAGERLVGLEKDGQDQLATVPEAQRLRPMAPLLAAHWRDLTARPVGDTAQPTAPMQAIEYALSELNYLPAEPLGDDKATTRQVDLGIAKATITTQKVEETTVGDTPAIVLESKADLVFTGEWADRITVPAMTVRSAWAADGSGLLAQRGTTVVDEKAEKATQHLVRNWDEQLVEAGRLTPDALSKAKANLDTLEKAMADAREGKYDAAITALNAYLEANPDGPWSSAVRSLHAALARRRLVAEPVSPARLRLMLRDLQTSRDQAGAQGNTPQLAQIDTALRQVAQTNAKQILVDAADPDPIVRDLAAFGLAFLDNPQGVERLRILARDPSAQLRGTALVSLGLRGEKVEKDTLLKALKDETPRVRGAAAMAAVRGYERGDATAVALLPALVETLASDLAWTRNNAATAIGLLAPKGSGPGVRGLIAAHEKESEEPLKALYRAALKELTGVEANTIEPYQAWLKEQAAEKPKG
ncbi:MAG: HEAT repeat domain-containing protein [Planctomycetes bacterium]|nr:HEAT repeat domain-containing protein [Planctomycetota bacterium]